MPQLTLFIDENDARPLIDWLNAQRDIAFLLPIGHNHWRAAHHVSHLSDGDYVLWHIPSGPPTVLDSRHRSIVPDPWKGWRGPSRDDPYSRSPWVTLLTSVPGMAVPYLDPRLVCVIRMSFHPRHRPYTEREKAHLRLTDVNLSGLNDYMRITQIQWVGDQYAKAPGSTWQFWDSLKKWVALHSVPLGNFTVDRNGDDDPAHAWAFPSALKKLKRGMASDAGIFNLERAIQAARFPR